MALNILIKLADDLDRAGKSDYVKNIEKVIDKICNGKYEQVTDYLIKAADFFDSNGMSNHAEAIDFAIQKLASNELDFKKEQMGARLADLRNAMNQAPEGPQKEKLRKELRAMESGLQTMKETLKATEPGTARALESGRQRGERLVGEYLRPERATSRLQPAGPDYMVDKENFTAPLRDIFKIRRLIRQIAVGTDFLPTKYGRTIKASGPFSWSIYWIIHSLRNKINLPKGWQTAFDKRNKNLEEKDADAMTAHIEYALGNILREAQMPQAMRSVVREREEGPEQGRARIY